MSFLSDVIITFAVIIFLSSLGTDIVPALFALVIIILIMRIKRWIP